MEDRRLLAVNPIVAENQLPGSPPSEWDISGAGSASIQGYATDISVDHGDTINFKVDTDATSYHLDIYRLGYYGGLGARHVATVEPSVALPQVQPQFLTDPSTGLIDAGNWLVSASWAVPADAVSGVYIAKLVRDDGIDGASQIPFIVRADESHSDLLFKTSDATWEAYNNYGGNSLYTSDDDSPSGDLPAGRAYEVSYNRPFNDRAWLFTNYLFYTEYPMIRWLEANGYDVSYSTDVDTDRRGAELLQHQVFLSVGHDEYWSAGERDNVEAARDAGVNLAFFSGNELFWKTRYDVSLDSSQTPYRTIVCYKESSSDAKIDPMADDWTGTWRDPRFSPPADGGDPENALTGTMFEVNGDGTGGTSIEVTAEEGKMRFWRNTSIATLAPGETASLTYRTLGFEWDEDVDNDFRPTGLIDLSTTTEYVQYDLENFSNKVMPDSATHSMTLYRASSGALVFSAGTIQFSWGLDNHHDWLPSTPDPRIQQATVNLFADMGVQPGTLQAGLVAATASTDFTSPTVTINPLPGAGIVQLGVPITITGTASDVGGGVVGGVEVSVDNGATWHAATGRESWSYRWTPGASGAVSILCRAVDDSGNLSSPSTPINGTVVLGTAPLSLWDNSTVPVVADSGDNQESEVGIRFSSDVDGYITGIKFYKSAANIGMHTGTLWTSDGTLLATATFTGETDSGWQQVNFATPVLIRANTIYVASYHAPVGHYAADNYYFATEGVDTGPLHTPSDWSGGPAGVFSYGASKFPTETRLGNNYWVDVVFQTSVRSISPSDHASVVATNANVTVAFLTAMNASTINASTIQLRDASNNLVPATVTYNATTRIATLQPTSSLTGTASYTVLVQGGASGVKDQAGIALASNLASTFSTGLPSGSAFSLWGSSAAPMVADNGDTHAVEVGVKFRSDVDGFITSLRFYKSAANTGVHVGNLWTSDGTLLASATFTNETASGWQQVNFATPVAIKANTTYVASYDAPLGHYAIDTSYFASAGVNSGPLHALASGVDGMNGVAAVAGSFPIYSYMSSNYWVDVVLVKSLVQAVSPVAGATNVATNGNLTITFSDLMDVATVNASTIQLRDNLNKVVPATVSYDAASRTATLDVLVTLAATSSYAIVVKGGLGGIRSQAGNYLPADVVSSFTTGISLGTEFQLWNNSAVPTVADSGITQASEVGVKFRSDVDGYVTAVRFYKSALNTGTHVGKLWTSDGTLLASATFTSETASGWQQVNFATPVAIKANTTYVVSYNAPSGHYASDTSYFATSSASSGPLHALAEGIDGSNGVYIAAPNSFPVNSNKSSNYWVDVVLVKSLVRLISPVAGATGVDPGATISVTFSDSMDAASINASTIQLRDASNNLVPATVVYNNASRIATLDPIATLNGTSAYTVIIKSGVGGVRSQGRNTLPSDIVWSYTTGISPGTEFSLWNTTTVPAVVDNGDSNGVEVGMKFRTDTSGYVTGVRFYKSAANSGPHIGKLWSSDGTLLASATFTGETAAGWQQVNFSTPVYVKANTTYVVSYNAPQGHYAIDNSYFASIGTNNGPLHALASGVDGDNGVAIKSPGSFPIYSYKSSNYWVDVVFVQSLVQSVSPTTGTTVAATTKLAVTFGAAMNATTINGTTIQLFDAAMRWVSATVSYDATSKTATLVPASALAYSTTYTAVVKSGSAGVRDQTGDALLSDFTWSFTTAAPPDTTPPTITAKTPGSGATGVATGGSMVINFSEALDPTTVNANTVQLLNASGQVVAATVSYNATTMTATLQPSAALGSGTTYTAKVVGGTSGVKDLAGNALASTASWTFTTQTAGMYTLWNSSAAPLVADNGDTTAVDVGMKFRSDVAATVSGVRFYKSVANTGTHIAYLWDSTGKLLASATFTSETASGWQQVNFATPVAIAANTTYIVSYYAPKGHYAIDTSYFASAGIDNGPLHALKEGVNGSNGVANSGQTFPLYSYLSSNYWVDVVLNVPPDTTPPTIATKSPAGGATGVATSASATVTFSEAMDPTTINANTVQLMNSAGQVLSAAVSYNAATMTATLQPTALLGNSTTYTARVVGGTSGVKDLAGNALASTTSWTFTTAANTSYSLWSGSATPLVSDNGDTTAVNVGVKFRSDVAATVNGVRFYKSLANTGTHVAYLWDSTGKLLASATFTSETASGWQQVNFATPVAIAANATYIVSYYAPKGHYAIDTSYFASSGVDNGPLHALQSGVDGSNGVANVGQTFPLYSYLSSNYWVDVVLSVALAADTTPPTVTAQSPANNATGVATGSSVTVTFSEVMNSTTINASTVQLLNASGQVVAATLVYNATTRTATLQLSALIATGTTYTVRVVGGASGVKDLAGNALAATATWSFTTVPAPTVIAMTPANGATGVSTLTAITATFSTAMNAATINTSTIQLFDSSNHQIALTASYNATTKTVALQPTLPLSKLATYTVRIVGGSGGVKDSAGNASTADILWSFQTGSS